MTGKTAATEETAARAAAPRILPNWRRIAPSVLTVWVLVVLGAGISMAPTVRSLPLSWDDQIFTPGALSLIESLRLHRAEFFGAMRKSVGLLVLGQVALLIARARMTAVIVDVGQNKSPRPELFARVPAYFAVTLLKVVFLGLCAGLLVLASRELPPFEGTLPPALVFRYGIVGVGALLLLGYLVIFSEILRLSLFRDATLKEKLRAAFQTLTSETLPLFATRALIVAVSLGSGVLVLCISGRPIAPGSTGAVFTFVLSQGLVLLNLSLEAFWLMRAERALANYCPPA